VFKPRQMVRLGREARGDEPAADSVKPLVGGRVRRTKPSSAAADSLLKDLAAALPLTFGPVPVEEAAVKEDPAQGMYERLVAAAQCVYDAASNETRPDSATLIDSLNAAIASLREDDSLLTESVKQRDTERTMPVQTAQVTALSLRLGLEIGLDDRRCLALGLCSLVHDIGMLTLPEDLLSSAKLTSEQFQQLRNHTYESQRMIELFGSEFDWMGKVVVQIHERHGGGGYPLGLAGKEIHELARIIGLADTYVAMATPRVHREAKVTYNALHEIMDVRSKFFDPDNIKALIRVVSIFPLGSLVKLNNGAIGRVVGANRLYPTRPLMEMLIDPQGIHLNPTLMIDLGAEPLVFIVAPAIKESVLTGASEESESTT